MEPVLTNHCEYDVAHLSEAMGVQIREAQKKKNLILFIAIGLLLAYSVYSWISSKNSQFAFYALLCVGMFALLFFSNLMLPRRTAKIQTARIRERYGSLDFGFQFREDGVAMLNPSGEEDSLVPYGEFSRIVNTAHLILLITGARQMIILDPSRFEGGTEEDFRRLMEEKCPRALPLEKNA